MSPANIEVPEAQKLLSGLFNNLSLSAARDGGLVAGIALMRRAMLVNPFDPARRVNLASQLIGVGEDDEAESLLAGVLSQTDKMPSAWQQMGVIKTHRGQLGDAIACFERGLALVPDGPQQKFDLAAACLRAGDFARGLPLFEHRAEILPRLAPPPPAPSWKGEKVKHIAVWGDQGHGDRIQFARFLPFVRDRAERISFLTDQFTVPLLSGYRDKGIVDEIGAFYPVGTVFDAQICVTSIPLVYGLTVDNIPPDPGAIVPAGSVGTLAGAGLKIGIAWQGNKDHPNDNIRSMPFEELLVLAGDPRNDLFSLQCGPAAADLPRARAQRLVRDMAGDIEGEWTHTAAAIRCLDLVVTVDTAIAHLAGALGVRTFLLLPLFNDWRWLHGRDDSPWYPSMRLFRQTRSRDWREVMRRVAGAVQQIHRDRAIFAAIKRTTAPAPDPHRIAPADEKEPDVAAVLRKVLRPGDCFVDVGANVGMHTVLAAELVGETGKVLAFEPGSNNLEPLYAAIGEHKPGRGEVEVVVKPLAAEAGPVTFHLCAEGGGGNALWDPGKFPTNPRSREKPESSLMQASTLDLEVTSRGLQPRLIKIDVEGAEQLVLEGGAGVLVTHKPPFIVAELHEFGLQQMGHSQQSLRELMSRVGYDTYMLFADGAKPYRLAPGEPYRSQYIINLLFSTQADVDAVWGAAEPSRTTAHVHGYLAGDAMLRARQEEHAATDRWMPGSKESAA